MKSTLHIIYMLSNVVLTINPTLENLGDCLILSPEFTAYHEVTGHKPFTKYRHRYTFISQNFDSFTANCINTFKRFERCNHGRNEDSRLILGGDLTTPPGFLKYIETDECRKLTMDLWNRGASINEAIESINSLSPTADESVMDNFMYGNVTVTKDNDYPPGVVDLEEEIDDSDAYDSEQDDSTDVNFGLLSNDEILLIRSIMEERVRKQNDTYKAQMIIDLTNDSNLRYTREEIEKYIEKFDSIATLLINLNKNVDRNLLDIDWIPAIEEQICDFVARKSFTVSTITWTEGSVDVTLKEENVSEKKIDALHDSLFSFIDRISRRESFHGLHNLGLMVSGS